MDNSFLYIDPGSGSYLVQMIVAAVLSGLFFFKDIWQRVKSIFTKKDSKNENESDQ